MRYVINVFLGMAKRPMGFPNPNFVQGQVSAGTPGTPGAGATQQLQGAQGMAHTGKVSQALQNDGTVQP